MENEGFVYVIKFSEPLGNPNKKHAAASTFVVEA